MKQLVLISLLLCVTKLFCLGATPDKVSFAGLVSGKYKELNELSVIIVNRTDRDTTFLKFDSLTTDKKVRFEFLLNFDKKYDLIFMSNGFLTKCIEINTKDVKKAEKILGYCFNMDLSLLPFVVGMSSDFAVNLLIAKVRFNKAEKQFEFDKGFDAKLRKDKLFIAQNKFFRDYRP